MKRITAFLLVLLLALVAGCTPNDVSSVSDDESTSEIPTETVKEIVSYIKENVNGLYDYDITGVNFKGALDIGGDLNGGIDGTTFQNFTEEVVAATLSAVDEYDVELGHISITCKYGDHFVNWRSYDGKTGTLVDSRENGSPRAECPLDELEDSIINQRDLK